ncbi:hypothetical protein [Actinoplanes sp. NPDC049265]|uniref:hypothetical protein n=1 Tax=Actinoplanes sp. NPDC049265 TaxID=3363902 RepID=UPI003713B459
MIGDPRAELARLEAAVARVAENLVELDDSVAKRDLDARALTGRTASEWAQAKESLTRLWEGYRQLTTAITEARALPDPGGPAFAHQVLGRSITLSLSVVPLAQRGLLGAGQERRACSPGELLATMEHAFRTVADVVTRAGDAWQRLLPASADLAAAVENVRRLIGRDQQGAAVLDEADRRLRYFTQIMGSDPLGVDEAELAAIRTLVDRADAERTSADELREILAQRLAEAHKLLAEIDAAERDAAEAAARASDRFGSGFAVPAGPDLRPDLMAVDALASAGHWALISPRLAEWTRRARARLDEVGSAADRAGELLAARNELRGRFESYQAKAKRRGLDAALGAAADRVREVLYVAPCDLVAARAAVNAYQDALREAAS